VSDKVADSILNLLMNQFPFAVRRRSAVLLILLGLIVNSPPSAGADSVDSSALPVESLRLFSEIFARIKAEYVEEIDDNQLLRDAVEGMLNGLDPHSVYLDQKAYREVNIDTRGEFGGLGLEVTIEDDTIRVVAPIDGTPAQEAGLLPGDRIVRLEDTLVQGMSLDEAVSQMRGKPGTQIRLLIVREGHSEPFELTLTRAIIRLDSVWSELLDERFGYARISQFQPGTAKELQQQLTLLEAKAVDGLAGLVLDLRNNPGGVLDGAVAVSDLFLRQGVIVTTRGRTKDSVATYSATPKDILVGAPIVVLVNSGSASASEIVSGALQDHKRAVIMGEKTFGKGSVQTILPLPMNDGAALKLTTARYYTPSDRSIQASGIIPDIESSDFAFTHNNENDGFSLRETDLTGHLGNEDGDEVTGDKSAVPSNQLSGQRDDQIHQAINLLKSMVIALGAG
jgi:carboxyl-terminal processing protease